MKFASMLAASLLAAAATLSLLPSLCSAVRRAEGRDIFLASSAPTLADSLSLDGVSGFIESRARDAISAALSGGGSDWLCDAFAEAINNRGSGAGSALDFFRQDAGMRAQVEAEIKARLVTWLPERARDVIRQELLPAVAGETALREAEDIAKRAAEMLDSTMEQGLDLMASRLYDSVIDRMRAELSERGLPSFIDITDIRGSVARAMEHEQVVRLASSGLARLVGEGTVLGIRARIEDALAGSLPPEAMEALRAGPEAFRRYAEEARAYMPASALSSLSGSVLNRPFIRLPTPAYASILAASAAAHYARAYQGMFVDPHELKRAVEVTKVMIWQIENKEGISLTLMQLGALARELSASLGFESVFDEALGRVKKPIEDIKGSAARLEELMMKPLGSVQEELRRMAASIESQLIALQETLVSPAREQIARIEQGLSEAASAAAGALPQGFPSGWQDAKEALGLPNALLGDAGGISPREALAALSEAAGLDDVRDKAASDLAELVDAAAGAAARGAAAGLEAVHLLGPAAAILGAERLPEHGLSDTSALDPVLLHSGEFVQSVTDLVIPGRRVDFRFDRIYRGLSDFKGELGWRWTHSYAERLMPWDDGAGPGYTYVDERGRKSFFRQEADGFRAPAGSLKNLVRDERGALSIVRTDGLRTLFDSGGRPESKCDRHGNCMLYEYDGRGLVSAVSDPYGRKVEFSRREDGLVSSIRDFTGRRINFEYNEHDELSGVRSPATHGLPRGALTSYRYQSPPEGGPRSHRISMIMDPAGRVFLRNRYDEHGRVRAQRYGDGPWMRVSYAEDSSRKLMRTWVTDAAGATILYEHDSEGRLLRRWLWEEGSYRILERRGYDNHGRLSFECSGMGRCAGYAYCERGLLTKVVERGWCKGPDRITRMERESEFGRISALDLPGGEQFRVTYFDEAPHDPTAVLWRGSDGESWQRLRSFVYDGRGRIAEETDDRGVLTVYEYYPDYDPDGDGLRVESEGGRLAASDDGSGGGWLKRVITDAREADGREAFGPPAASERGFRYDPVGNIIAVAGPEGGQTRLTVDPLNRVVREERHGMWARSYRFDANGSVSAVRLERPGSPIEHRMEHDDLDRPVLLDLQVSASDRAVTRYEYDAAGRLAAEVFPEGNRIELEYDSEGRLSCAVRGAGTEEVSRECVERNADGFVTAAIDGSEVRVDYELNAFGEIMAERDAMNNRREYRRDSAGRVTSERIVDAGGRILSERRFTWSGRFPVSEARRLWRDDPAKSRWIQSSWERSASGLLLSETTPMGRRLSISYDGLGLPALIESPGGTRERFERDSAGRLKRRWLESEGRTYGLSLFGYGPSGLIESVSEGEAPALMLSRDGAGRIIRAISPAGVATGYSLDDLGRRLVQEEAGGGLSSATRFEWDGNGRLKSMVDANGNAQGFDYDAHDRLSAERYADGSLRRYVYDGAGRVISVEERDGGTLSVEYDARGLLFARSAARNGDVARQSFEHDGAGRLTFASDQSDFKVIYDSLSRPVAEQGHGGWTVRVFDDDGRAAALSFPSGHSVYYSYSADGLVRAIMGKRGRVASILRDPLGNVVSAELGVGLTLDVQRDSRGRELVRRYRMRGREIAVWETARDSAGLVVGQSDSLSGVRVSYRRDGLGRLSEANVVPLADGGGASSSVERFSYDAAGNIVEVLRGPQRLVMSLNELNQVTRLEEDGRASLIRHDSAGRLVHDGRFEYSYDPFGRLSGITDDHDLMHRLSYDAAGRLTAHMAEGGMRLSYHWDGWRLASYEDFEEISHGLVYADDLGAPLAELLDGSPSYYLADRSGSIRAVHGIEGFGRRCDYSVYGSSQGCLNANLAMGFLGFIQGQRDDLVFMRHRHYHPGLGRFLTPDPLGTKAPLSAGQAIFAAPAISYHRGLGQAPNTSLPNRPMRANADYAPYPFNRWTEARDEIPWSAEPNLYLYAGGDPVTFWDPWGLASLFFDRNLERMMLFEGDGYLLTSYEAANRTTRPDADPLRVGGRGPVPDGIFAVGIPEFYSAEYRDDFYRRFGLGTPLPGESSVTGPGWSGEERPGYNLSQGLIRFRVGAPSQGAERIVWNRGVFVHGGRDNNHTARTWGCIRARDDELETLAANFIALGRQGDAVDRIYVE